MQAANYVGTPVIAYGEVVATIHADAYFSDRMVDEVDRDVLASFAASLGPIVERAILIEQLQAQQTITEKLIRSTGGTPEARQVTSGSWIPISSPDGAVAKRQRDHLRTDRMHAGTGLTTKHRTAVIDGQNGLRPVSFNASLVHPVNHRHIVAGR